MTPVEGNIELLAQAVMSQADGEAEQMISAARAKAEKIRQQAKEQAEAERRKILEQAAKEAERIRRQTVASAQIKARMLELSQREQLLTDVFQAALERLPDVVRARDYSQIAEELLREAVADLGAPAVEIRADAATRRLLTKERLLKISKELKVKMALKGQLDKGLGVIVQTVDGRMQYDNTLETRLNRMQNELRSPVHHILMGEVL